MVLTFSSPASLAATDPKPRASSTMISSNLPVITPRGQRMMDTLIWDPPSHFLEERWEQFFKWMEEEVIKIDQEEPGALHPIECAARVFLHFTELHLLEDGNGKLAELLMNTILVRFGYPAIPRRTIKENRSFLLSEDQATVILAQAIRREQLREQDEEPFPGAHHILLDSTREQMRAFMDQPRESILINIDSFSVYFSKGGFDLSEEALREKLRSLGKWVIEVDSFEQTLKLVEQLKKPLNDGRIFNIKIFHSPHLKGFSKFALFVYSQQENLESSRTLVQQALDESGLEEIPFSWKLEVHTFVDQGDPTEHYFRGLRQLREELNEDQVSDDQISSLEILWDAVIFMWRI